MLFDQFTASPSDLPQLLPLHFYGMTTQAFYAELPVCQHLFDLADPACYTQVPEDWYVLITDIVGSTEAIAAGQYKSVNIVGASSIIAVLNELHPLEIPFVFGGDGASLLVPPEHLHTAREVLLGVRALANQTFGMELRVGVVPVVAVNRHHPLKLAKLRLSPQYCQASFMGGGITYATELVKQDAAYRLDVGGNSERANLTGLECRWQEIPSMRGHTLSLIVAALTSSGETVSSIYREVFTQIQTIFGDPRDYHPIATEALQLSFNPRQLAPEAKLRSGGARSPLPYLMRAWLENLLGAIFMGCKLTVGEVNWGNYKQDVQAASDFQKVDDVLRMVISGTSSQIQQLIQYLEHQSQVGRLAYGVHVSDRALLTCLILDRRNCHFHLVDGADGGYALAASDLKGQLHQKAQNWKAYAKLARQRGRSPHQREFDGFA